MWKRTRSSCDLVNSATAGLVGSLLLLAVGFSGSAVVGIETSPEPALIGNHDMMMRANMMMR